MSKRVGPWTVHESSERFRNEFIRVVEDRVTQPDGRPGSYTTVHTRSGVSVLPIEDGSVHLVRVFRYALGRDSVEALSGAIEEGQDPLTAAQREASEEMGIRANSWEPHGCVDVDTSVIRGPVYLFTARDLGFGPPHPEPTEALTPVRMELARAVEMVMTGEITHSPTIILILKAHLASLSLG